jgi:hypothetical protein
MTEKIAGFGRKRPSLNIPVQRLHLDPLNPRLPESIQGKSEMEVLKGLYEEYGLDELAISMSQNGYFDEEPLVVIPRDLPTSLTVYKKGSTDLTDAYMKFINAGTTHFTVAEGNRRLATAMVLLDSNLRHKLNIRSWEELTDVVRDDLSILPVIVYSNRDEVVPYLGIRHITGIKKWDSYAKARYIVSMIKSGSSIEAIEHQIGDKQSSVRKNALSYYLLEQAHEELDFDTSRAKEDFSFLILSVGQVNVKRYLGLPVKLKDVSSESPVPKEKITELGNLLSWLFGEGKKVTRVIKESRDITNKLVHVVASPYAIKYLEKTRDLSEAFERSNGEETMLLRTLSQANSKLEQALGVAHRYKSTEVVGEVEKCVETAGRLL